MAYVNLTENGCVRSKPVRMLMIERAENRRFSLVMLTAFVGVYLCATAIGNGDVQVTTVGLNKSLSFVVATLF